MAATEELEFTDGDRQFVRDGQKGFFSADEAARDVVLADVRQAWTDMAREIAGRPPEIAPAPEMLVPIEVRALALVAAMVGPRNN